MDELQTKFLNLYDLLVSIWLTLGESKQLAILVFLAGFLGFVLSVLRIVRAKRALARSEASDAETSVATDSSQASRSIGVGVADEERKGKSKSGASVFGGLRKTRAALQSRFQEIFSKNSGLDEVYAELEELLITSDMGVKTTRILLDEIRGLDSNASADSIRSSLKRSVLSILSSDDEPEIVPQKVNGEPLVIAVIGVNGVGKTTTIGKLAWQFGAQGKRVLIAAGDTFRAAAGQQLGIWAERAGATIACSAENAKPSTVAYEAVHEAKRDGYDVLILDTAGRLHTRVNLMNELQNVLSLIARELPGAPHETILVVDATTGQNALQQAIDFNARAPLSGVIVTKLDGSPKGGIVVAIKNELDIPIRYIGVGEQATDLKLFSAEEFAKGLFGDDDGFTETDGSSEAATGNSAEQTRKIVRKRNHA